MGLLARQVRSLQKAGFTDFELGIIRENLRQRPQVVDLKTDVWQSVMTKRKSWLGRWITGGGTRENFAKMILDFYNKSKKASPWDWLKLEYPSFAKKAKTIKDFHMAAARRATARLKRLGKGYQIYKKGRGI